METRFPGFSTPVQLGILISIPSLLHSFFRHTRTAEQNHAHLQRIPHIASQDTLHVSFSASAGPDIDGQHYHQSHVTQHAFIQILPSRPDPSCTNVGPYAAHLATASQLQVQSLRSGGSNWYVQSLNFISPAIFPRFLASPLASAAYGDLEPGEGGAVCCSL